MRVKTILRVAMPFIVASVVPALARADDTMNTSPNDFTAVSSGDIDRCVDQCADDCADGVYGKATGVKHTRATAKKAKTGQVASAPTDITLPVQTVEPDQGTIDRIRAEERARAAEEFSADQQRMQAQHDSDIQKARDEERAASQADADRKLKSAREDYNKDLSRVETEKRDVIKDAMFTPMGLYGLVGGGATNFTEPGVAGPTGVGGYWDAKLGIGTRSIVGAEVGYVGSSRDVAALGLNSDAYMLGNGIEAVARLNVPITPERSKVLVEPFTFAGAGWNHYNIMTAHNNTSDIDDVDDVLAIPLGVGLGVGYSGFTLDGRVTYRHTVDSDMFGSSNSSFASDALNSWAAGAALGFEF